jgi:hypothetical protein
MARKYLSPRSCVGVPQARYRKTFGKEVSRAFFDKGAERIGALVEHEHSWAVKFWESLGELGYRLDPQFVRYIADRKND